MEKNNSQKGSVRLPMVATIAIIVIATAIISVYATIKLTSPKTLVSSIPTPALTLSVAPSPIIAPSPTPDITADVSSKALATEDWKTYSDKKLGFEFKYPLEWIYSIEQNDIVFREEEKGPIEMLTLKKFELQKDQSFKDVLVNNTTLGESDSVHPAFSDFKLTKLGTENFYYIFPYLSEGQYSVSYWYIKGPMVLQFELYADATDKEGTVDSNGSWQKDSWKIESQPAFKRLNQIISTFKIVNNSEITAIKTYKNTKLGISFDYPATATLDNESSNGIIIKTSDNIELNISNLAFGIEGYGADLPNYPDKDVLGGHTRTVKGYDSPSNKNVLYWILLGKDGQNNNWSASSTLAASDLNKETIALFDQIIATFRIQN